MSDTMITVQLGPRWWQLWRRFKAWRNRRAMVGAVVTVQHADGHEESRIITAFDGTTATVADEWTIPPTGSLIFRIGTAEPSSHPTENS